MRGASFNHKSSTTPAFPIALPLRPRPINFHLLRKASSCSTNRNTAATCNKLPASGSANKVNSFPKNSGPRRFAPDHQRLKPAEVFFDLLAAAVGEEAAGLRVFGPAHAGAVRPAGEALAFERFPNLSRRGRAASGAERSRA